ncbi:A24 family peptidase [Pusillimonas sp.]|uniref:prepilin peptidase n=1 Tax=Pusillimonas sp. TaxID=3040095 RepID=UPI0029BC3CCA|nr:A24 family peptidase [Pusillimonas sp.]MDX3893243.1 A24 family peptidase [Pusillimonas sp.]
MTAMWAPWNIGTAAALLIAAVFALALCMPLSRIAYRLPRALDPNIPAEASALHRFYRTVFWLAGPLLALSCVWRFGATPAAVAAIVYVAALLALAWIDAETGFLPDLLTLPLLWLGLLVNLGGAFSPLADAVVGAAGGYMALWLICGAFLLLTRRQGMGNGDFKLLAALGAWLGWMALPWILLAASLLALAVVLARRLAGRMQAGEPFSFGPYLALVGIAALLRL